ncbi:Alpha/Beta hydrolase protein [Fusarium oxysporum f. sp. albedinis]|nr:Alpha/Beta hydrolase protein [Fusarium oxysporum f. sp. albedinis]KAK2469913.1 hypothetical protein H9L39_18728 [Fusarium oxysporum f. sp. albedinis]
MIPGLDNDTIGLIETRINQDREYQASARGVRVCFALVSNLSDEGLVFTVNQGTTKVSPAPISTSSEVKFTLSALSEHWREFFAAVPKCPYQSYWGMLRVLGRDGVEVFGDTSSFTAHARVWRIILDLVRQGIHRKTTPTQSSQLSYLADDEADDDAILGHYTWVTLPGNEKCKIYYETSGSGRQDLLFLHTAGADSRQFHSLMLHPELRSTCTMYAFDLPGHGRSFPAAGQYPLSFANSEELYISVIRQMCVKLKLSRAIVSGASMGGQVCLAVALHARELDIKGVIPCESCDFLPQQASGGIYSLTGDESILTPERVCGMMSPTSPAIYKRLNWWIYSSQAARIFPGDLKFYFGGWNGRERIGQIDTRHCSVYMLTGEYDYSCTPDASRSTASNIRGAVFEEMRGLGHFPMSEDPGQFLPYFKRALKHIQEEQG